MEREKSEIEGQVSELGLDPNNHEAIASRLATLVEGAVGEDAKKKILLFFYDTLGARNRRNRTYYRDVGNTYIGDDAEDQREITKVLNTLARELVALKKVNAVQYEAMKKRNGGTGVCAYVTTDGELEPLDFQADVARKRAAAPTCCQVIETISQAESWRSDQRRMREALARGESFWERRRQRHLEADALKAAIDARHAKKDRVLALLVDIIVNAHNNGANEIQTQLLLYLSLSRQCHGQSEHSTTHDSSFSAATSYGTGATLKDALASTYIDSFPARLRRLLEESPDRQRDSRCRAPAPPPAKVLILKVDNYVKRR